MLSDDERRRGELRRLVQEQVHKALGEETTALRRPSAPADPGRHRRRARLRPDRPVPARPGYHRGHGERSQGDGWRRQDRRRQRRRRRHEPQLGLRPPAQGDARGRRRRGSDLPEHAAAVRAARVELAAGPEAHGRRRRAALGGVARPQPLAGRLLQRRAGPARRDRADVPERRARHRRRARVGEGAGPHRRHPHPRVPSRLRHGAAVRARRVRADLAGM